MSHFDEEDPYALRPLGIAPVGQLRLVYRNGATECVEDKPRAPITFDLSMSTVVRAEFASIAKPD